MIRAAIFDMDGLLVDSEPLWQEAELEVFGALGVPITREGCVETRGLRADEVVALWNRRHPWAGPGEREVHARLLEAMAALLRARGRAMPGALQAVESMRRRTGRLALASSSPMMLIDAVLDTLGVRGAFDVVHSAESEAYGKPHPAVFLSARAARMACIAVPEAAQRHDPRFSIADRVLDSLLDLETVDWASIEAAKR